VQSKEPSSWLARRREKSHEGGRRRLGEEIDLGFLFSLFFSFFYSPNCPPLLFQFFSPLPWCVLKATIYGQNVA